MFTGIVDHCGTLVKVDPIPSGVRFFIECNFTELALGESISVDGVCLTVTQIESTGFSVELSPETLRLAISNEYRPGATVNLERALRMGDRFGGHMVSGHVDTKMKVLSIKSHSEFVEMRFEGLSSESKAYVTTKGSITVNGVSLTINEVWPTGFAVMLIPHTLERTNLSRLIVGSSVNIEFDWMSKTIIHALKNTLLNMDLGTLVNQTLEKEMSCTQF